MKGAVESCRKVVARISAASIDTNLKYVRRYFTYHFDKEAVKTLSNLSHKKFQKYVAEQKNGTYRNYDEWKKANKHFEEWHKRIAIGMAATGGAVCFVMILSGDSHMPATIAGIATSAAASLGYALGAVNQYSIPVGVVIGSASVVFKIVASHKQKARKAEEQKKDDGRKLRFVDYMREHHYRDLMDRWHEFLKHEELLRI